MSDDQDKQILIKIAKGDSKSFSILFEKYQNLVYGYSMKMLKDKQKAEDVTQEAWLRVVRNAEKYQPTGAGGRYPKMNWFVFLPCFLNVKIKLQLMF